MEENYSRLIVRQFPNGSTKPFEEIGLHKGSQICRVWSIYHEPEIWQHYWKFNPYTGEQMVYEGGVKLENLTLIHGKGVFLEDQGHDWLQTRNYFKFFGHSGYQGELQDLIIEYEGIG